MNAADSDIADTDAIDAFIDRWSGVTASEISTAQSFDLDLCSLLGVDPPTHTEQYKFERDVTFQRGVRSAVDEWPKMMRQFIASFRWAPLRSAHPVHYEIDRVPRQRGY